MGRMMTMMRVIVVMTTTQRKHHMSLGNTSDLFVWLERHPPSRVVVSGDRNWSSPEPVKHVIKLLPLTCIVVEGEAKGLDLMAKEIALSRGMTVEGKAPNWAYYGKGAGPVRNKEMLDTKPDLVVCFHNDINTSKGTKDMMTIALGARVPTFLVTQIDWNACVGRKQEVKTMSGGSDDADKEKYYDKIAGMMLALMIGDAAGMQFEFNHRLAEGKKHLWRGLLEHKTFTVGRFAGLKEGVLGQYSDDTEMTLVLARRLVADQGYNRSRVLLDYMAWANSGTFLGRNTRALFKGVKTENGYNSRYLAVTTNKELGPEGREALQSNGALMRCSPLSLLYSSCPIIADCGLTNPSCVALDTNLVYITSLRLLLEGTHDIKTVCKWAQAHAQMALVKQALTTTNTRDLSDKKGWCVHGIYAAFHALQTCPTYFDLLNKFMPLPRIDTDTIAAIAGAMYGAAHGLKALLKDPRINAMAVQVINMDPSQGQFPRDKRWLVNMTEFNELVFRMTELFMSQRKAWLASKK